MKDLNLFDLKFENLPTKIPVFPLIGALMLPGGQVPLNVFEPRYLNMVTSALAGGRLLALVQPRVDMNSAGSGGSVADDDPVFQIGCLGRITAFEETEDGRITLSLLGLIRFSIIEELALKDGYRRVRPDYSDYRDDLRVGQTGVSPTTLPKGQASDDWVDRARLIGGVKSYFDLQEVSADWHQVEETPDDILVTSLSMACRFDQADQQALLECRGLGLRAKLLIGLIEAALTDDGKNTNIRH